MELLFAASPIHSQVFLRGGGLRLRLDESLLLRLRYGKAKGDGDWPSIENGSAESYPLAVCFRSMDVTGEAGGSRLRNNDGVSHNCIINNTYCTRDQTEAELCVRANDSPIPHLSTKRIAQTAPGSNAIE